jgi:hypothetical protein
MIALKTPPQFRRKLPPKGVPEALIYEIMDGQPIYYRGYEAVLSGEKQPEEIMGRSSLQAFIIDYLLRTIYATLPEEDWVVLTNELGLHLNRRNNLSGDICLYERATFPFERVSNKYADFPPNIAIEMDTKADLQGFSSFEEYASRKTRKLHNWGTEKVIWVVSWMRHVWIAEKDQPQWTIHDWNQEIPLLGDVTFNVAAYLNRMNIVLPEDD